MIRKIDIRQTISKIMIILKKKRDFKMYHRIFLYKDNILCG